MEIDLFFIQLVLLFVPGILWAIFHVVYCLGRWPQFGYFVVYSFMFGVTIYTILGIGYGITSCFADAKYDILGFASGEDENFDLNSFLKTEYLWSLALSLFFSLVWLFVQKKNLITSLLHYFKLTKSIGGANVWTGALNREELIYQYVRFTDFKNDIIFEGEVEIYSEHEEKREILLRNARVFTIGDNEVRFWYERPLLYVRLEEGNIWMEFPKEYEEME